MNDLVSIVVPVYNMENSITDSVNSFLNQTYKNIEIILIDDGSKDDSYMKCKALANLDSRIKAIHTENRGSGPARNEGIHHASGTFIYFPDADDYLAPNSIEILVNAMNANNCDLVVFGFKNVNQKGQTTNLKTYENKSFYSSELRMDYSECMNYMAKWGIQGAPWNKFFDLNIIKDNSVEYPALRRHQDEGFIGRYMSYSKKVTFISDVLYTYYTNDLKKEWDKYPRNYLDCVVGLYECRKENILIWNPEDKKTHDQVVVAYITGAIKALELLFSEKYNFARIHDRKAYIKEAIQKSKLEDLNIELSEGLRYQKVVLKLIKNEKYNLLYMLLAFKVFVEHRMSIVFYLMKR